MFSLVSGMFRLASSDLIRTSLGPVQDRLIYSQLVESWSQVFVPLSFLSKPPAHRRMDTCVTVEQKKRRQTEPVQVCWDPPMYLSCAGLVEQSSHGHRPCVSRESASPESAKNRCDRQQTDLQLLHVCVEIVLC